MRCPTCDLPLALARDGQCAFCALAAGATLGLMSTAGVASNVVKPDPQTLRELAALNRAIANACWSAYYGHARDMNPVEAELQLAAANAATKLAHLLEQRAQTLEAGRNVTTLDG